MITLSDKAIALSALASDLDLIYKQMTVACSQILLLQDKRELITVSIKAIAEDMK
jgi:hypothetical protein